MNYREKSEIEIKYEEIMNQLIASGFQRYTAILILNWNEFLNKTGREPRKEIEHNGKLIEFKDMTQSDREEILLFRAWKRNIERKRLEKALANKEPSKKEEKALKILEELGVPIVLETHEEIKEPKSTIDILYEIDRWGAKHSRKRPRSSISRNGVYLTNEEMTEEEKEEVKLGMRWRSSKAKKIIEKYRDIEDISQIPEEDREIVSKGREILKRNKDRRAEPQKFTDDEILDLIIKWKKEHNGDMPRGTVIIKGKYVTVSEISEEERIGRIIYQRWSTSKIRKIILRYEDEELEDIPEQYRDYVVRAREAGIIQQSIDEEIGLLENLEDFFYSHNERLPKANIMQRGITKRKSELTPEQQEEVRLRRKWNGSSLRKKYITYCNMPEAEIPLEEREKIKRLKTIGIYRIIERKPIATLVRQSVGKQVQNNEGTRAEITNLIDKTIKPVTK